MTDLEDAGGWKFLFGSERLPDKLLITSALQQVFERPNAGCLGASSHQRRTCWIQSDWPGHRSEEKTLYDCVSLLLARGESTYHFTC